MRHNLIVILAAVANAAAIEPACDAADTDLARLDLSPAAMRSLQLALFFKTMEAEVFGTLPNMTESIPPVNVSQTDLEETGKQDAIHRDALQRILRAAGEEAPRPCRYRVVSGNMSDLLSVGRDMKTLGVSVALGIAESVTTADNTLLPGLLSIAATEARHSALLEVAHGSRPSPSAFETALPEVWAYNLALQFVIPGSCNASLPLQILPSLGYRMMDGVAEFSWDPEQAPISQQEGRPLFIAWVNQLGPPAYTSLVITGAGNGTAAPPTGMSGSTFAVLTSQNGATTVADLSGLTLAGPTYIRS